ncbi:MAG: hypothetical protein OXF01_09785 [Gemmatimonadetes bacterium]|nr:hypothetical protein [Gemmatimonadota bacterium]
MPSVHSTGARWVVSIEKSCLGRDGAGSFDGCVESTALETLDRGESRIGDGGDEMVMGLIGTTTTWRART